MGASGAAGAAAALSIWLARLPARKKGRTCCQPPGGATQGGGEGVAAWLRFFEAVVSLVRALLLAALFAAMAAAEASAAALKRESSRAFERLAMWVCMETLGGERWKFGLEAAAALLAK